MNKKATNPYILSLARESRGILQQKLAKDLNITQGTLSKIESSVLDVSEELTKKIAKILAYPESLFYLKGSELPTIASFRRKNEKVSRKIMKQVNAKVNLYRVLIETYLQNVTVKLT
ncbi:MAG: multiprotein-bridging factor 1 family protein, partial [bacterium]